MKAIVILGGLDKVAGQQPDDVPFLRLGVIEVPDQVEVRDHLAVNQRMIDGLLRFAAANGIETHP